MSVRPSFQLCLRCAHRSEQLSSTRFFTSTATQLTQRPPVIKKKRRDPYAVAQARARKAANISRQQTLLQERADNLGDPVRGVETEFVASFDTPAHDTIRNFLVSKSQLEDSVVRSQQLNNPLGSSIKKLATSDAKVDIKEIRERIRDATDRATEAMTRISDLQLGSSKDRLRLNIQRCIDKFGRHNTDRELPPGPNQVGKNVKPTRRIGQDTGSSEVQIGILTARIRAIADGIEAKGLQDKHNKRFLRLLVHRRQKLLQYLRRSDRGGPRWQNCISTLGLTEGTWRGEISLPR